MATQSGSQWVVGLRAAVSPTQPARQASEQAAEFLQIVKNFAREQHRLEPRTMKPSTKFAIVAALFATAVVAVGVVTFLNRATQTSGVLVSEVTQSSRPVQTLTVVPRRFDETFDSSGVLRAKRDVTLMAEVMGSARTVHRDLGDACKAGDPLVQLGTETYGAAAQQARAALEQARVGKTQAEQDLGRVKALSEHGAVAPQELERATNAVRAANAAVQQAEAAVRIAQRPVHDSTVRCPFDGAVAQRLVEVGQLVGPQAPLFRIVDTSELTLSVYVSAAVIARVRDGQPVRLVDATAPDLAYVGKVSRRGVAADPNTHTFPVEVSVPGGAQGPRPGQVLRVSIVIAEHEHALAVPWDSLRDAFREPSVFVARSGKAARVAVRLGPRLGNDVIVAAGLSAGDNVIVVGQEALGDGDAITQVGAWAPSAASLMAPPAAENR
jgi:membrane fusion protein (multidrug efflux system)